MNAYVRTAEALMSTQDGQWRSYVRHVMPRLISAADLQQLPDDGLPDGVCQRAVTGILKLASAHSVMITPRGINWFKYKSAKRAEDVSADEQDWYQRVTQIAQNELESSNFYAASISLIIDRCATGTGLMLTESDDRNKRLLFTHVPAGTYRMSENKYHEIDTVCREFKFTAHQAAQAFGEEALDKDMRAALDKPEERFKTEFRIWHLVMPRDVAHQGNAEELANPKKMPWASVYIAQGTKHVLQEGGYQEFPYMATRFLKFGNQVYGESALAPIQRDIERLLELEDAMTEAAKAAAFPRVLATADIVGQIDMRAGGVTVISPESAGSGYPREWASSGQISHGLNQMELFHQAIDDALFVNQLQSVSQVTRQMTATEAQIRENEKLMTFSQTFTQFTADFRPLMERVFCLLFRLQKFPTVGMPKDLFEPVSADGKGLKLAAPEVRYLGRLSKALESARSQGLMESLTYALEMYSATQDPAWMDYFKPYDCMRFITDESNVDTGCLRTTAEAQELQAQREMIARQQMQLQMMQQQADVAATQAQALPQMR